jgi:hypothetical protein
LCWKREKGRRLPERACAGRGGGFGRVAKPGLSSHLIIDPALLWVLEAVIGFVDLLELVSITT